MIYFFWLVPCYCYGWVAVSTIFDMIADCGLVGHSYADDAQTYSSVPATNAVVAMQRLAVCIERIEQWMGRNRLKFN